MLTLLLAACSLIPLPITQLDGLPEGFPVQSDAGPPSMVTSGCASHDVDGRPITIVMATWALPGDAEASAWQTAWEAGMRAEGWSPAEATPGGPELVFERDQASADFEKRGSMVGVGWMREGC
ncbi:MAG: hypothetical protein KC656_09725 [Myxococcales bacterium]|nr:hypothetical protein [Myxococcales bacterium]MCA9568111.1 hypothetical protein [Myxococcales bacterium]MCB9690942.1 hypothetical protein [Alphaproteobacteria bacterium]